MNTITRNFLIGILSVCILYIVFPKIIKTNCKSVLENIKEQDCEIRIEKTEHISYFKIIGENSNNFQPCECIDYSRWWMTYKNEMKEGDYFIKKKGDLYFQIVKEDTTIQHEYKCYETEIW